MWTIGSGLATPWRTLAVNAAGIALLVARPRPRVTPAVGWLGALSIFGISWERSTRESFRHPDRETTPLIASGLALSIAMALLGLGQKRR
ncbi:prolipoprotein diacylglyceryltransferase [Arthrobacter pascens]|uniref:hypothetical protein n=1 Tax=Arthrobacter pascens TaxID=1677 RepID=UPI00279021F8|nr:hypothetical protein [Arthrobacter pascens]MDQ0679670.1 prolipoprotein diacylglyceryltransferase [Arthrobacter pascens]